MPWVGDRDRNAVVTALANGNVDGNSRKHRNGFLDRHLVGAAMPENFVALATIGTYECVHVLDDAEDGAMHLAKHLHRALRVKQRNILRSGDDDRAINRNLLCESELRVASAGGQIDDEKILRAPQ